MKSSEEVYTLISHVRHKKVDGSLYLMSERMAWSAEKTQTFPVSYKYSDIKTQKISPDGKVKIQLQIVLHTGETANFHFNSSEGQEKQLNDRKKVKELLQQLLPRFRKQLDAELEEKNILLQQNPQLFTLYKELVVTQIITPEDFWENYAKKYKKSFEEPSLAYDTSAEASAVPSQQSIGVSASFLSDLIPESDGANGIKYNLTTDIIDSIFRTYPSVRKKHEEYVPYKISEIEFWTKFFQSHYFYRDRNLTKQSASSSKDYFFSECAKLDEKTVKDRIEKGIQNNPLLNLDEFSDEAPLSEPIFDLYSDVSNQNLSLIQRFNQHSILLAQATFPKDRSLKSVKRLKTNHYECTETAVADETFEIPSKADMIHERLHSEYGDLEGVGSSGTSPRNGGTEVGFKLNKPSTFFQGPADSSVEDGQHTSRSMLSSSAYHHDIGIHEVAQYHEIVKGAVNDITGDTSTMELSLQRCSTQVLTDLSPGGRLMHNAATPVNIINRISPQIRIELKNAYVALNELLRHFYACFPVTNPKLEEKVTRMKECLTSFHAVRLTAIEDKVRNSTHPDIKVTQHLIVMLQSAFSKYANWMKRKSTIHTFGKNPF